MKVRGGFTVPRVSSGVTISSTRSPIVRSAVAAPSEKPLLSEEANATATEQQRLDSTPKKIRRSRRGPSNGGVIFSNDQEVRRIMFAVYLIQGDHVVVTLCFVDVN